jgi:pyruvate carboxylase subunit B
VVRVLVTVGQSVQAGEGIVVIEAMKMENELRAARAGVVSQVRARPGQSVEAGAVLAVVD